MLVEIRWIDSSSHPENVWRREDEYLTEKPARIRTLGYVIGVKESHIVIAGDRGDNKGFVTMINRCMTIPVGCIKSIRVIKKK